MTTFYTVVSWLVILGYWLLIAGVTLRILMKRRAVPSAMAWLLIIYILPLVGIIWVNAGPNAPVPCGPPRQNGLPTLKPASISSPKRTAAWPHLCSSCANAARALLG